MNTIVQSIDTYLANSPSFIVACFWLSVILLILTLLTFVYICILRYRFNLDNAQERQLKDQWEEIFRTIRNNEEPHLPREINSRREILLSLWVNERENADENYGEKLDRLASMLKLDKTIKQILAPFSMSILPARIWCISIALTAAQWVDSEEIRHLVRKIVESDNNYLASNACATLLKLEDSEIDRLIISTLLRFPKRLPYITSFLGDSGAAHVLHVVELFLDQLPSFARLNFISLAEVSKDKSLAALLVERLRSSPNEEETAAILRAIGNLGSKKEVRAIKAYLRSDEKVLQINAAKALAKIGEKRDRKQLVPLLSNENWNLRYRAAKSYIELTGRDDKHVSSLVESLEDRYAKDIVRHAYAEKYWCLD